MPNWMADIVASGAAEIASVLEAVGEIIGLPNVGPWIVISILVVTLFYAAMYLVSANRR